MRKFFTTAILLLVMCSFCTVSADTKISLPDGSRYGTIHTYTVWDKINWGASCRRLLNFSKEHEAISDSYGIVTYGGYFCGALTTTFGQVGDMLLVVCEDNIVYPVIMADAKNQSNYGCNRWGHQNGKCVVEFEILSSKRKSLYGTSGGFISDRLAKPILSVINLGSVFEYGFFLDPYQSALDNGLTGYLMLSDPYEGRIVQRSPEESISRADLLLIRFMQNLFPA